MSPNYASAHNQSLHDQIGRDPLATDRTILANERTFLAYIRTAMTLLVGGLSLYSFFPGNLAKIIGIISIFPALTLFTIGIQRYRFLRKNLLLEMFRATAPDPSRTV